MVLLKDVLQVDNGASFHSVDLHVHTYGASDDVKDTWMTPEAIIDSAVSQALRVIAITDHNNDMNGQRAVEYAESQYPDEILVLPGVEVTTAHGHLLAYFSPDRLADLATFLSRLDLIGEKGAKDTRTQKSMADAIAEAERLGGICIAAHIDREKTGFHMFAEGFQNWKGDIIRSGGLYGLECDSSEALRWYSLEDEPGSTGAERKKILESRRQISSLSARFHLAHIQGSDSHTRSDFEGQSVSRPGTRMKLSELSFSAVKVALVDPIARVRASSSVPESFPRIVGVSMTGGFLHNEIIHFSDNLNCLIGGRGTGKTTAIRAIAYAFGIDDAFAQFENCPEVVTVFCQGTSGTYYRYTRTRGGETEVKAREDASVVDVPIDIFHLEYYGQGELAKVAEDPLSKPELLQAFLDRHINLRDLQVAEASTVSSLRENAARLTPLEGSFSLLPAKKDTLKGVETKLKVAEEGNLREVVSTQRKLASERAVRDAIESTAKTYSSGFSLAMAKTDFDQVLATAGECTTDEKTQEALSAIRETLERCNATIQQSEKDLNETLKSFSTKLTDAANSLKASHQRQSSEIAAKIADLKSRGVAATIPGLNTLLKQKTELAKEIVRIERGAEERKQFRAKRAELRKELHTIREAMSQKRKGQLAAVNQNLRATIEDYKVFVKYEDSGLTSRFEGFLQEAMHGTHLQDTLITQVCQAVTPAELADLVEARNCEEIAKRTNLSDEWARRMVDALGRREALYELQLLSKQPKPVITVRTRSTPPREILVQQLSDGQRHTILLTIAMLAESNDPLVIDQPEDDLDNAFIFTSVVRTLRSIKERRQIVLVTHNANIAVLGDSELILPMYRDGDNGKVVDRGSIDSSATKKRAVEILEGGIDAFRRRKEMYSH